jgi:hypothetical protein
MQEQPASWLRMVRYMCLIKQFIHSVTAISKSFEIIMKGSKRKLAIKKAGFFSFMVVQCS